MSAQDHWVGEVVSHVCSFVPKQKWFSNPEDANVWVSAYRVYHVPSDIVSLKRPLIANFEQARTVFLRWNAPYQKLEHKVIEQKDGRIKFQAHPLRVYWTGDGVLLLLIAPLPDNYDGNDQQAARERVTFMRALLPRSYCTRTSQSRNPAQRPSTGPPRENEMRGRKDTRL